MPYMTLKFKIKTYPSINLTVSAGVPWVLFAPLVGMVPFNLGLHM